MILTNVRQVQTPQAVTIFGRWQRVRSNPFHPVGVHRTVIACQCETFLAGLCDQHAVERIAVVSRQRRSGGQQHSHAGSTAPSSNVSWVSGSGASKSSGTVKAPFTAPMKGGGRRLSRRRKLYHRTPVAGDQYGFASFGFADQFRKMRLRVGDCNLQEGFLCATMAIK